MSETILSVDGLNMHFPIGGGFFGKPVDVVRAVDNVSFSVRRRETFGIVGESGSGKTTLGRCLMRVLTPSSGRMMLNRRNRPETNLADCGKAELRDVWKDMRMVFQDPQASLNPRLRVLDIVGQSLQKTEGLRGRELADRVSGLLRKVGLRPEFLMRYPNAFSGGQRQRLGIARALATNPELIIADEAVSALDVSIQAQILNLMQDLQDQYDLTYIFIAHDLAVVEHICDRIAVMYLGQIVELADRQELFSRPKHPYTRALLDAVPVPDPRRRRRKVQQVKAPVGAVTGTGCRFASRCPQAGDICRNTPPPVRQVNGANVLCHFAGQI